MFSNVCRAWHAMNYSQCTGNFLHKGISYLFIFPGLLSFTSSQISHQYHFINMRKNWTEAQRFCREMYTDLATVTNEDEMNSLFKTITDNSYDVYTGLYRGEVFRWHWTLPDSVYNEKTFQNWGRNQPDQNNNEGCAAMDNNGKWSSDSCDTQMQFVCFNGKIFLLYCCLFIVL